MLKVKMDTLDHMFQRQKNFMMQLNKKGKLSAWPVDLTTKDGQCTIRECIFNMFAELMEANAELKNKSHRMTDEKNINLEHYKEELADALAFFLELCIMSGINSHQLFVEYCKKNDIVHERLQNGY